MYIVASLFVEAALTGQMVFASCRCVFPINHLNGSSVNREYQTRRLPITARV